MIKRILIYLVLLTTAIVPSLCTAQEFLDSSDLNGIVKIARNYGSATLTTQENGYPKIIGKIDNIPYTIRFRNCITLERCGDINFRVGFLLKPDINIINEWNKKKRFSKAYLDDEKDVILEWDVILSGGISQENLDRSFSYWRLTLSQFTAHIGFK